MSEKRLPLGAIEESSGAIVTKSGKESGPDLTPESQKNENEGGQKNKSKEEKHPQKKKERMITPEDREKAIIDILSGAKAEVERILGVDRGSTDEEKLKAFRAKALLVHPDHNKDRKKQATQAMIWLMNALHTLKSPQMSMPEDVANWAGWAANAFDDDGEDEGKNDEDDDGINNLPETEQKTKLDELREAPEPIQRIYEDVTPHVLQLLKHPEDKTALQKVKEAEDRISQYYDGLTEPVTREEQFSLNPPLLQRIARDSLKALQKNPEDVTARQNYETQALMLQKHGDFFGWPKNWRLDTLDSRKLGKPTYRTLYSTANNYIETLKIDTENAEAIAGLKKVNREIKVFLSGNTPEMALDGHDWIDITALCDYYRQANGYLSHLRENPSDVDVRRKADTLNDELADFISKHEYPHSWVLNIPPDTSTTKHEYPHSWILNIPPGTATTTRYGEPIYGYREWVNGHDKGGNSRMAYLFAVLPNKKVPIGELRSGSLLGRDARERYLASAAKNKVRKCEEVDKSRWQELERVFVHPSGTKREIWAQPLLADKSATGQLKNKQRPLMTRSEYLKLRGGIDGDYDIAELYEEYGQTPPARVTKRLPSRYASKTKRSGPLPLETAQHVQSRRKEEDSTEAMLEAVLAKLQLDRQREANKPRPMS